MCPANQGPLIVIIKHCNVRQLSTCLATKQLLFPPLVVYLSNTYSCFGIIVFDGGKVSDETGTIYTIFLLKVVFLRDPSAKFNELTPLPVYC